MPGADTPRLFDGRYELLRRLGAGGMATVWLAEDTSLHRKVAIKVLAERYAEDEQFVERFRREAQSAAGLNHPNIVAIYDRGVSEGAYYIAMEYLDGPTLKDRIDERGGLEPTVAIGFAMQILSALRFAHNHGVVHRDIKPHNVVVAPDGRLKVTDFGIARAGASQMTEVGSIVGTAQYLSPEQARGEIVGPPSDLYSVGIVLYEMLTGHVPFEGDSAVAIAMKHLSEEPVPPSVYVPSTPPALEQVVMRALAKDAADRYQTAEEMGADLDRVRRGAPVSPRTEQLTRVMAPARTGSQTRVQPPRDGTRVWDRGELPPRQPPVAPAPPKRARWPWFVLALLVIAAGIVAAVALSGAIGGGGGSTTGTTTTTSTAPRFANVPNDLLGKASGTAQDEVANAGLVSRIRQMASNEQPGVVIRVTPTGGTRLARGKVVTLFVSKGQDQVTVPKVTGSLVDDATTSLTDLKLVPAQTDTDSLQPKGTVISQDPAAGSVVAPGSTVTMTVSTGPKPVQVPDVRGEDEQTARQNLESVGLKEGTVSRQSSTSVASGAVISTDPAGNTQSVEGTAVNIILSTGIPTVTMPDVIGETPDEAATDIANAGLVPRAPSTVQVSDPAQDGVVVKTSPKAGIKPRQGSSVIVVVGAYTPPGTDTTSTDTTGAATTSTDTTASPPQAQ